MLYTAKQVLLDDNFVQCTVLILKGHKHPVRHAQFSVTQKEEHDYKTAQNTLGWTELRGGRAQTQAAGKVTHDKMKCKYFTRGTAGIRRAQVGMVCIPSSTCIYFYPRLYVDINVIKFPRIS